MRLATGEYPPTDDHISSESGEESYHEDGKDGEDEEEDDDEDEEEVDESVLEDMRKLEESFEGISQKYRMINRIGEGLCFRSFCAHLYCLASWLTLDDQ